MHRRNPPFDRLRTGKLRSGEQFDRLATPLISAVEGTVRVTEGGSWSAASERIYLGLAFDAVFVVAAFLTFHFILED